MAKGKTQTPLTAQEVLSGNAKREAQKKRVASQQKDLGAAGSKNFDGYLFPYAESRLYPGGHVVVVPTRVRSLQELGVTLATIDNTFYEDRGGRRRRHRRIKATKRLRYSFITRKKPKKGKAAQESTKGADPYRREWRSIAIPEDAREIDILKFVGTWSKKPEAIEIDGNAILLRTPKSAAYQGLKKRSARAASTVPKLDLG